MVRSYTQVGYNDCLLPNNVKDSAEAVRRTFLRGIIMAGIKTKRFFCHTSSRRVSSPNPVKRLRCWAAPIIALLCLTGFGNTGIVGTTATPDAKPPKPATFKMPQRAHTLLQFERNVGQAPDAVRFITRANGLAAAVYDNGMALTRNDRGNKNNSIVQLNFVGARQDAAIEAREASIARTHYLQGSDPAHWRRDVPSYAQLRQNAVYPGVDLVYYSRAGELEYDLVVNPGADPSRIRMRVKGEYKPQLSVTGDLLLDGAKGALRLHRPLAYQNIDGVKKVIDGRYVMLASNEVGFRIQAYDKRHPLIIDPTFKVLYSTYLGGVHDDQVGAMTIDTLGNAYVIGNSGSEDWPVSGNAYQATRKGLGRYVRNVVVTKFDASGTLIYSTFIGGTTNDYGSNIAVDPAGNAYLTGNTTSPDFPTTANAYQSTFKGTPSAYIAVLSPDGSSLNYSTLYGGNGGSNATGIAFDPSGAVVIAGSVDRGCRPRWVVISQHWPRVRQRSWRSLI